MSFDLSKATPEDLAKASFKYFFTRVLGFKWSKHHEEWYHDMQQYKRLLTECARGHGKTMFFSVGFPLWLAYRGIPVDILIVSYSEEQVRNNIMKKIDDIINSNEYLIHLRPGPKQLWSTQLKTFANGVSIRGESFGSSVRGAHPHYLIVDDPLKDKGGMVPEEQYHYFMTALTGTAKRETAIFVVGTPLDYGDLLEQLENNPSYIFKAYPAENPEKTVCLFSELYNSDDLRRIEKEIGTFAYSREYLLQRIDPHTQVFKDKYRIINETEEYSEFAVVRTLVDPAISENETSCDSAVVTGGISFDNHLWELDTRLFMSDDPAQILKNILAVARIFYRKFYDYAVVIEREGFQKVLAYDLREALLKEGLDIRVIEVSHQGIQGKHQRIEGLQPKWESKAIHLLPESPLISQFRYYRPKIKGFKIDGIDAFSWIRHPDVAVPVMNSKLVDEGVPPEAWA